MYKAIRQLEFVQEDYPGEVIDQISETIPNQALSINEVLTRFTQGTLGSIGLPMHYDIEEQIVINDDVFNSYNPTLSPDFDLTDAEAYLRSKNIKEELETPLNEPKAEDKLILKQDNQNKQEE